MEFKGTKGNWERITSNWDLNQSVFLKDTDQQICLVNSKMHNQMHDALLISKAPEMLEFLQSIVSDYENGLIEDIEDLAIRSEQLIKEATEL